MQIFPKWANKIPLLVAIGTPVVLGAATFLVWYYWSPWFTDVGYQPTQPVPYSHKLHAGQLGMDCQYCHVSVEKAARANVPATSVCMNCHKLIKTDSAKLTKVRESFEKDVPLEWVRIHKIPDYAFFEHSPHINAGVGCVECHGRIDQMIEVAQNQPLSMGWCLECHRDPAPHLRPKELVTKMDWVPTDADKLAALDKAKHLNPPQNCSGCHR